MLIDLLCKYCNHMQFNTLFNDLDDFENRKETCEVCNNQMIRIHERA